MNLLVLLTAGHKLYYLRKVYIFYLNDISLNDASKSSVKHQVLDEHTVLVLHYCRQNSSSEKIK